MKRIQTLVWGSVITNGEKFYLLSERPEARIVWQREDTLKWLACSMNYKLKRNSNVEIGVEGDYDVVYYASHLIFGSDAALELLDDPKTVILVEYFSPEEVSENI